MKSSRLLSVCLLVVLLLIFWELHKWHVGQLRAQEKLELSTKQNALDDAWKQFDNTAAQRDAPAEIFFDALRKLRPMDDQLNELPTAADRSIVYALQARIADYNGCRTYLVL